jgi:ketosteroid isomerase-like protein
MSRRKKRDHRSWRKHLEAPLIRFERLARKAKLFVPVLLALALGIGAGWQLRGAAAKADEDAVATAQTEIDRFLQALSGNGDLEDVLGDAFQLFRSNGQRFDRAAYLSTPSSLTRYAVDSVEAIEADGVLTATFLVSATGEVDGVERETVGLPHIAVFTKVDGAWKLQAYASLGALPATGIEDAADAVVEKWVDAAASGDADIVGAMLAPEFQLVRSDGAAYDAAAYLARGIPKIDAGFEISDVVATGFGDHLVVRYDLDLRETVGSGQIVGRAPRLTVFRRDGDDWLVVAHANFGQIER